MNLSPYLDAYFANQQTWLNSNASFASYPGPIGTAASPPGWIPNTGGPNPTKVAGFVSPSAMQITGAAGADAIMQSAPFAAGQGWYLMDCQITLNSGALTSAGAVANFYTDQTESTYVSGFQINFATAADVTGTVHGAGVPGQAYHWRLLFFVPQTNAGAGVAYPCAHYAAAFGSNAAANQITFEQLAVRQATPAEIAAGNPVQGLPVFPLLPGLDPEIERGPSWSTKVLRASAGNERRTAQWPFPIWNYVLKHEVIRDDAWRGALFLDEVKGIWELFNTVQGQFGAFAFLDQGGFLASNEWIGVGDGATTTFQLIRHVRSWSEPVLAPFSVTAYVNGVAAAGSLGPSGQFTFASAPASGSVLSWTGGYFMACRFTQDDLNLKRIAHQLWSSEGLKFSSVRSLS